MLTFVAERTGAFGDTGAGRVRAEVLAACRAAGQPTGGGKTLFGLAFALEHAAKHGPRRVVYVAPYLSILEQNARVVRDALGVRPGDPDVFEHHSLADPPGDDDRSGTAREAAARRAESRGRVRAQGRPVRGPDRPPGAPAGPDQVYARCLSPDPAGRRRGRRVPGRSNVVRAAGLTRRPGSPFTPGTG